LRVRVVRGVMVEILVTVISLDLIYLRVVVAIMAVMTLRREILLRDVILVLVAVTLVIVISLDLMYLRAVVAVMAL
jgi:hypothetical protein